MLTIAWDDARPENVHLWLRARLKAGATEKPTPNPAPSASAASAGWPVLALLRRPRADFAAGHQPLWLAPQPTVVWFEVPTSPQETFLRPGEPELPSARGPKARSGLLPWGLRPADAAVRPHSSSAPVHSRNHAGRACHP